MSKYTCTCSRCGNSTCHNGNSCIYEVFSAAYALFIVYVSADGLADVPCANYVMMMIMLL